MGRPGHQKDRKALIVEYQSDLCNYREGMELLQKLSYIRHVFLQLWSRIFWLIIMLRDVTTLTRNCGFVWSLSKHNKSINELPVHALDSLYKKILAAKCCAVAYYCKVCCRHLGHLQRRHNNLTVRFQKLLLYWVCCRMIHYSYCL